MKHRILHCIKLSSKTLPKHCQHNLSLIPNPTFDIFAHITQHSPLNSAIRHKGDISLIYDTQFAIIISLLARYYITKKSHSHFSWLWHFIAINSSFFGTISRNNFNNRFPFLNASTTTTDRFNHIKSPTHGNPKTKPNELN